jgi:hypothetical protein
MHHGAKLVLHVILKHLEARDGILLEYWASVQANQSLAPEEDDDDFLTQLLILFRKRNSSFL